MRHLGLSLAQIRDCIDHPDYSLRPVLEMHLVEVRKQIAMQQKLCARLERLVEGLRSSEEISVEEFAQTIEETVKMENKDQLSHGLDKYLDNFTERARIGTEHLLLGMLREGDGIAAGILTRFGISFDKARTEISRIQGV